MAESRVKRENYITIQGFMLTDLKLKGNELIVYAIIYGFSQNGEQVFNGGLQYLADWTNSTKHGVMKNLKSLCEKGYIKKNEKIKNGVKFVEYYVTELQEVRNKVTQGMQQSYTGGMQQSLPNNISLDNTKNNLINNNNSIAQITNEFEILWNLYPRKKGKQKALAAYEKARKEGATFESVKDGIEAYKREIKAKRTETQYIKHGSTWFNGKGWLDEYAEQPTKNSSINNNNNTNISRFDVV